jgi:hypothetical protein
MAQPAAALEESGGEFIASDESASHVLYVVRQGLASPGTWGVALH